MLDIYIDTENTIVHNTNTQGKWTIETPLFFGDIFATLEKNFPNFDYTQMSNTIVNHISNKLIGKKEQNSYLFHCEEYGVTLYQLLSFIDDKIVLTPTLKDIENLRITHRMTTTYLPININQSGDMCFKGLKTVTQVMIAALYYYAYNGYKLKRCVHCEKWFATKTLKEEFCKRNSPCSDISSNGKKLLGKEQPCKIAVDTIKKRLQGRKKSIYDKWKNGKFECEYKCEECPYSDCIVDDERCHTLCENYKRLRKNINSSPKVDNIIKLHRYLYSDEMPKQERPNRRKSNEEKRRSKEK